MKFKKERKPRPEKEVAPDFDLRSVEDVDLQAAWDREAKTRWTTPGLGVSVPGAFGADWGYFYGGMTFQNRTELGSQADGIVFLGFGLGDATRYIGIDSSFIITNLEPFAKDWGYSLKIHRNLSDTFALAAGVEFLYQHRGTVTGSAGSVEERTPYFVMTKVFRIHASEFKPFSMIALTGGIGGGRFRTLQDYLVSKQTVNAFASAGVRIYAPIAVSAAWTGRDIDVGMSITPFRSFRLSINPSIVGLRETISKRIFAISFVFGDSIFEKTFPFFSQTTITR